MKYLKHCFLCTGMVFEGSPHSGIDDATNIARIAVKLLSDGCSLSLNEQILVNSNPLGSRTEVRYQPYYDPDSRKAKRKDKRTLRTDKEKQEGLIAQLEDLNIESATESEEEALDDLINYYQIQSL